MPLDHGDPAGNRIPIAVIRQKATDPSRRLGSLVLNPGGPGASGVDFVRSAGPFLLTDEVRSRFDLVSFDPRGISRSRPLRCFESADQWEPAFSPFEFPITEAETEEWIAGERYMLQACDQRAGAILNHMATADVARDMDLLRQALGDARLNYVGYSYGSYLGVTYANLFPDRFRTLVVDGVVDPVAWATGTAGSAATTPFSTRGRSDAGSQATLEEFFRLCDSSGPASCAFAPGSSSRYAALVERLKASPIQITNPFTGQVFDYSYSILISDSVGAMYNSFIWPFFASFLSFLETNADPAGTGAALATLHQQMGVGDPVFSRYENRIEGLPGVACPDTDNPIGYGAWTPAAETAEQKFGYFGRLWTWRSSLCAEWRGRDAARYVGPFTARTAAPVLVVGNWFDPATRYEGAKTVAKLLPNSRLLTVRAWGHTSGGLSSCANQVVTRYLVDQALPPNGTVCPQDFKPFAPFLPTAGAATAAAGSAEVARILTAINLPAGVARQG